MSIFPKDPDAVLDYAFDWATNWLDVAETISSHTIAITGADSALVKDSDAEDSGTVTVWLSAGTAGLTYAVSCEIVTSQSRTDERTIYVKVRER